MAEEIQQVGGGGFGQPEHAGAAQCFARAGAGGRDGAISADVGGDPGSPLAQQDCDDSERGSVVQHGLQPLRVLVWRASDEGHDWPRLLSGGFVFAGAAQDLGFQFVECGVQVGHDPQCGGQFAARGLRAQQECEIASRDDHRGTGPYLAWGSSGGWVFGGQHREQEPVSYTHL